MNRPQKSDAGRLDGCQNPKRDRGRVSDRSLCPHTTAYEKSGHCRIEEIEEDRVTCGDESEEDTENKHRKDIKRR